MASRLRSRALLTECGIASRPCKGETESGDLHLVKEFPGGLLVAAVDGLGHGPEAAIAARTAVSLMAGAPHEPVSMLIRRCHEAMRRTRGAAMTLASFSARPPGLTWVGVGNVEACLLRGPHPAPSREGIMLHAGIVGYQLPRLNAATIPVQRGDLLIMATDGIASDFASAEVSDGTAQKIAEDILSRFGRNVDDALVVAVRYGGRS